MTDAPEQRSEAWFEARKNRITGSIAAGVLGLSPWMTRADVMRMLVRQREGAEREFLGNIATSHGQFHEDAAAWEFTLETGIKVTPAPFIPYDEYLGASPDGYTDDGGVCEFKCPFGLSKKAEPDFKSALEQPYYMAQMDVEMLCADVSHCHFFQYVPARTVDGVHYDAVSQHEVVQRNDAWLNENLPKLRQFWAEMLEEPSDEHLAPLRVEIDTVEVGRMIKEYDELSETLERLTERKKDLLGELVALAGSKDALLAGTRKLTLTRKVGAISYAKAIKEIAPDADLEKWRGKPSEFWGLR